MQPEHPNGFYSCPRQCEDCDYTTTSRDDYWRHVIETHGIADEDKEPAHAA